MVSKAKGHRRKKRVLGDKSRPRLCVFRSNKHIYAQVIDDARHSTLACASTQEEEMRSAVAGKTKKDRARYIGEMVAKRCLEKGISKVVFDRNGFLYHGRVSALADGARAGGLLF